MTDIRARRRGVIFVAAGVVGICQENGGRKDLGAFDVDLFATIGRR